ICNIIFSFTFTVILMLVSASLFFTVVVFGTGLVFRALGGHGDVGGNWVAVVILPYLLMYLLDKQLGRRFPGLVQAPWFRKLALGVYRVYGTIFCAPLVGAITFVLVSNVPRRRFIAMLMLYLFSPIAVLFLILGVVRYENDIYYPDDARGFGVSS